MSAPPTNFTVGADYISMSVSALIPDCSNSFVGNTLAMGITCGVRNFEFRFFQLSTLASHSRAHSSNATTSQIFLLAVSVWVIVDCIRFGWRFSSKAALMTASVFYTVIGATLSGLGSNDPKACVDLRKTSIFGTILTGIGIILSAWASRTNPDSPGLRQSDGGDSAPAASGNPAQRRIGGRPAAAAAAALPLRAATA
jgi:hypothetical protein